MGHDVILYYGNERWNTAWTYSARSHYIHLHDVWGSSSNNVFAVGKRQYRRSGTRFPLILHYDSQCSSDSRECWRKVELPDSLDLERVSFTSVWGSAADDVYVGGGSGRGHMLLHYDGTGWQEQTFPRGNGVIWGLWGTAADDIVAATSSGMVAHYNGTEWSRIKLPDSAPIFDIWGAGSDRLFAVGTTLSSSNEQPMQHYDGTSWERVYAFTNGSSVYGVWGVGPDNVFAISRRGRILHYDGNQWRNEEAPTDMDLRGIGGHAASGDLFAVGQDGTILQRIVTGP